ncbi:MAG: alpha/beta hydrolase [Flavobacteriaceae bacterium]
MKNHVKYTSVNSFETLNRLDDRTKNIWFIFHGIGFLSRYFLNFFKDLPKEENFIIAPQAPSKYYLDSTYKKVGASWLTREDTSMEINNVLAYLDAVYESINIPEEPNVFVLGYSQGVSIAARWVAGRKINCNKLIFYAGGLPNELGSEDFDFLSKDTEIIMIHGDEDPYLSPDRLRQEKQKLQVLFKDRARMIVFEGGHELIPAQIQRLIGL